MAVRRRVYEEIIDIPSHESSTSPPNSLFPRRESDESSGQTNVPSKQSDYNEVNAPYEGEGSHFFTRDKIGHTWPDLALNLFSRPQFMPTALVLIAFIIFCKQLQKIDDIWRPLLLSGILNSIWYGVKGISSLVKHFKA